ncbi:hypothetical protein BDV93DRAFT_587692 [Ceratobasidium sp. AG-I]|nr:hypothetical protein BDV93DRAFT_587692 [Ceratobasidium sp. AG-I]
MNQRQSHTVMPSLKTLTRTVLHCPDQTPPSQDLMSSSTTGISADENPSLSDIVTPTGASITPTEPAVDANVNSEVLNAAIQELLRTYEMPKDTGDIGEQPVYSMSPTSDPSITHPLTPTAIFVTDIDDPPPFVLYDQPVANGIHLSVINGSHRLMAMHALRDPSNSGNGWRAIVWYESVLIKIESLEEATRDVSSPSQPPHRHQFQMDTLNQGNSSNEVATLAEAVATTEATDPTPTPTTNTVVVNGQISSTDTSNAWRAAMIELAFGHAQDNRIHFNVDPTRRMNPRPSNPIHEADLFRRWFPRRRSPPRRTHASNPNVVEFDGDDSTGDSSTDEEATDEEVTDEGSTDEGSTDEELEGGES